MVFILTLGCFISETIHYKTVTKCNIIPPWCQKNNPKLILQLFCPCIKDKNTDGVRRNLMDSFEREQVFH